MEDKIKKLDLKDFKIL